MNFELQQSITLLQRTPIAFKALCYDMPATWTQVNEGEGTWSAFDIIGHLIHGEQTDWIPRARIILGDQEDKTFEPFDRYAQEKISVGKSIEALIDEFTELRKQSVIELISWNLTESDLQKTGIHPELGVVTLKNHLAIWTIHDCMHLHQLTRVMVKQYKEDIGPWVAYSSMLNQTQ